MADSSTELLAGFGVESIGVLGVYNAISVKAPDWMRLSGMVPPAGGVEAEKLPRVITGPVMPGPDTRLTAERIFSYEALEPLTEQQDVANWIMMIYGSVAEERTKKLSPTILDRVTKELGKRKVQNDTLTNPWNIDQDQYKELVTLANGLYKLHNLDNAFLKSNGDTPTYLKMILEQGAEEKDWFNEFESAAILKFSQGTRQGFALLEQNSVTWQVDAFGSILANGSTDPDLEIEKRFENYGEQFIYGNNPTKQAWVNTWNSVVPESQWSWALQLAQNLGYVATWNQIAAAGVFDGMNVYGAYTSNDAIAAVKYPHRYLVFVRGEFSHEQAALYALMRFSKVFNYQTYADKETRNRTPGGTNGGPAQAFLIAGLAGEPPRDATGSPISLKSYWKSLQRGQGVIEGVVGAYTSFGNIDKAFKPIDNYVRASLSYRLEAKETDVQKRSALGGLVLQDAAMMGFINEDKLPKPGEAAGIVKRARTIYGIIVPENNRVHYLEYVVGNGNRGWQSKAVGDLLNTGKTIMGMKVK